MQPPLNGPVLIRNVRRGAGACGNVLVRDGRIDAAASLAGAMAIDGKGGLLLPGLADHHIHLLAEAARENSLDVSNCAGPAALTARLRQAAQHGPVRAVGLDDGGGPLIDRWWIDAICPHVSIRVQYRTGALWVLNSLALEADGPEQSLPSPPYERGADGKLTGRVWRGGAPGPAPNRQTAPSLAALGARLARWGVTAVTDASVTTDQAQVDFLASLAGGLPQKMTLMTGPAAITPPPCCRVAVGPVKIMLDEASLPTPEALQGIIAEARAHNRTVAAHCVTDVELATMLSALDALGAMPGDRIEHGAVIPEFCLQWMRSLGVTVVTQPAFILARGDRYLRDIGAPGLAELYRLRSLLDSGIKLAGSSDAPYGPANPWAAIKAACDRQTASGAVISDTERLDTVQALKLYLGSATSPATPRRIVPGADADLCVLHPGARIGVDTDPVAMTMVAGRIVWRD
jgi:predicted amidohydrolase YtcJ